MVDGLDTRTDARKDTMLDSMTSNWIIERSKTSKTMYLEQAQ